MLKTYNENINTLQPQSEMTNKLFHEKRKKSQRNNLFKLSEYELLFKKYCNEDDLINNILKEIENGKNEYKFKIISHYCYNDDTTEDEREIYVKEFISKMHEIGKLDKCIKLSQYEFKNQNEIIITLSF